MFGAAVVGAQHDEPPVAEQRLKGGRERVCQGHLGTVGGLEPRQHGRLELGLRGRRPQLLERRPDLRTTSLAREREQRRLGGALTQPQLQ